MVLLAQCPSDYRNDATLLLPVFSQFLERRIKVLDGEVEVQSHSTNRFSWLHCAFCRCPGTRQIDRLETQLHPAIFYTLTNFSNRRPHPSDLSCLPRCSNLSPNCSKFNEIPECLSWGVSLSTVLPITFAMSAQRNLKAYTLYNTHCATV